MVDFNLADLTGQASFVTVTTTGEAVEEYPFDRVKFFENRRTRFSLITTEMALVRRHYTQEHGYFVCYGGLCCKLADKPAAAVYLYPVVQYLDVADNGKLVGGAIRVRTLVANREMYNAIVSLQDIKGDATALDLVGSLMPGNDRFPKTQILDAGPATWRQDPANLTYVQQYFAENSSHFLSVAGKVYTDQEVQAILEAANSAAAFTAAPMYGNSAPHAAAPAQPQTPAAWQTAAQQQLRPAQQQPQQQPQQQLHQQPPLPGVGSAPTNVLADLAKITKP